MSTTTFVTFTVLTITAALWVVVGDHFDSIGLGIAIALVQIAVASMIIKTAPVSTEALHRAHGGNYDKAIKMASNGLYNTAPRNIDLDTLAEFERLVDIAIEKKASPETFNHLAKLILKL